MGASYRDTTSAYKISAVNLKGKDNLDSLNVDTRIILRWTSEN
jgi:hypothetical protein